MVKYLSKALLLALLVAAPVIAKQAEWEKYRNQLLGPMRVELMESCALGRKFNAAKLSYWAEIKTAASKLCCQPRWGQLYSIHSRLILILMIRYKSRLLSR